MAAPSVRRVFHSEEPIAPSFRDFRRALLVAVLGVDPLLLRVRRISLVSSIISEELSGGRYPP